MAMEEILVRIYQTINLLGGSSQHCQDRIGVDFLPSSAKLSEQRQGQLTDFLKSLLEEGSRVVVRSVAADSMD
jgi:hypothetical protein